MLVLTRRVGEAIAIGDDIKVVVIHVKGKQVRLGIKAGPETMVYREEIYQNILAENRSAAKVDGELVELASRWISATAEEPKSPPLLRSGDSDNDKT